MVFIVSYDLNKQDKNYDGVFQAIKDASTGAWCHVLESTWIIKSNYTSAGDISTLIRAKMDDNDGLFVCELNNNKQGWISKSKWDNLNNNIFN